ncbi:MAG: DinB family protein [Ignavibacteria bacterium]|nr:DinB family protein [Ignavibacteria bacterium]
MNNELLIDFCKAVRDSTLKRLKTVPEGYETWRISKNALSFAEIAKHLVESDDWTIKKINEPAIRSILPAKGSIENCSREEFSFLILELGECLVRKIKFINSLGREKMESKIYDDRFNDEVSIEWIILRGNLDHEIHHRGQIAVYLRMLIDKQ